MQRRREEADRAMAAADAQMHDQAEAREARQNRQEADREGWRNALPVEPKRKAARWHDDQWYGCWNNNDWHGWWNNQQWAADDPEAAPVAAAVAEEPAREEDAPIPRQGPPPKALPASSKAPPPHFTAPQDPPPADEALQLVDQLRETLRLEEHGAPGAQGAPPGLPLPPPPPPRALQGGNQITAGVFTRPKPCAAAKEKPQRD